ncbi:uncharacterized protein FFUJ_04955 [Fusarium fujikuroi IMI 58289]|uniref:Uncharacterized protein n=1 Tax=Gibberella fujikuroi (strain CBS 195.34 / IMI 58289 / NRRL A-6831) TaxID=1279085 RepID=S0DUV6_GIBF5|nr:uncharacterized protein FFUJ_04955 [Fusarium fujikuroi IMI 58289]CCT65167.1 uncharacterized protein FFUJ_04955 [Fusarium fujikuroi IMI 58289]
MATPDAPWTITHSSTDAVAPAWIDSPNIRGTLDILQSCILTLIACIYTALHLDVPVKTAWHYIFLYKLKWVAITLFAPEIALYMAADQLQQAWNLKSKLRSLQKTTPSDADHIDIDMAYTFFIIMGGVRVNVDDILSIPDLHNKAFRLFESMERPYSVRLSPRAVTWLAERGHWIPISKKKIDDKSKADYFQKILVVMQVIWMVLQCIARKIQNLPLSLLEVHTMVHVVCAIFLYLCWFRKPLNVLDPEIIKPGAFEGEIALLAQRQFYPNIINIDDVSKVEEMQLLEETPESSSRNWIGWSWMRRLARPPAYERLPDTWANPRSGPWVKPEPGLEMWPGDILPSGLLYHSEFAHIPLLLSEQFLRRWDAILSTFPFHNREVLVKTASFVKVNRIAWDFEMISPEDDAGPLAGQDLFLARLPEFKPVLDPAYRTMPFSEGKRNLDINFSVFTESEDVFGLLGFFQQFPWLAGLALLLSGIYGGVHLSAWNWAFPSSIELLMWKISCLYIAGALALYFVMAVLATAVRTDGTTWLVTYIAFWFALFVYMAARFYVVFESFFSLRRSPAGVYISPVWVEMFPHF